MKLKKYGVVYTPERLAEFTVDLLYEEARKTGTVIKTILDPACGECALLYAANKRFGDEIKYFGIDVDKEAIVNASSNFNIINNDSILPKNVKKTNCRILENQNAQNIRSNCKSTMEF